MQDVGALVEEGVELGVRVLAELLGAHLVDVGHWVGTCGWAFELWVGGDAYDVEDAVN